MIIASETPETVAPGGCIRASFPFRSEGFAKLILRVLPRLMGLLQPSNIRLIRFIQTHQQNQDSGERSGGIMNRSNLDQQPFQHQFLDVSKYNLTDCDYGKAMQYGTIRKAISNDCDLTSPNGTVGHRMRRWGTYRLYALLSAATITITLIGLCVWRYNVSSKFHVTKPSHFYRPGVGFQLTPSYGISSIRYANRTLSDVARVEFSTENVDRQPENFYHMLQRLAEPKSYRDPYNWYCHDDNIGVSPFPTKRSLRKAARRLMGLPSTEDVGRLADAIRLLKEKTEEKLGGQSVGEVMITAPMFNQLCRKDMDEAAEYVGLTPLARPHETHAHDVSDAYAGYGLGLCRDYGDHARCKQEELAMPTRNTLTVLYTTHVLMAYLMEMQTAVIFDPNYPVYMLDWQAGLPLSFRSDLAREAYEELLVLRLMQLPLGRYRDREVERVVLMGESAENEVLETAVRRAMERLQPENMPEIYNAGTEYVTARGAAEFAWRAMHDSDFDPLGCQLEDEDDLSRSTSNDAAFRRAGSHASDCSLGTLM